MKGTLLPRRRGVSIPGVKGSKWLSVTFRSCVNLRNRTRNALQVGPACRTVDGANLRQG